MNASSLLKTLQHAQRANHGCLLVQKRFRYKKKWAVNTPSKTGCELALEHFDAFYKPLFGRQWPSVRVSLLSSSKYAALINNGSESGASIQKLAELGTRDLISAAATVVREQEEASHNQSLTSSETPSDEQTSSALENSELESGRNIHEENNSAEGFSDLNLAERTFNRQSSVTTLDTETGPSKEKIDGGNFEVMDNILAPDAALSSADLQQFMPTEQVFSEREEQRQAEYSQSLFQERPVSVTILPGSRPVLPPSLKLMAFPKGDVSDFPRPRVDEAKKLNYYLLDAASILPVLALDLRPNDNVLDLCAAPGGKTLAMLQMILTQGGHITSNDVSMSRLNRLKTVLRSYLSQDLQAEFVTVTNRPGQSFRNPVFNKVLVDAPCNSDRHVLLEEDNNLFRPGRINDRLQMTSNQKDLLLAGIKSCKPGGAVVYSTCTLAAVQNDGVVQAALEELWETSGVDMAVEDLAPLAHAFAPVFTFHPHARLGQLVLPSLTHNFGPMYFCKLRRLG